MRALAVALMLGGLTACASLDASSDPGPTIVGGGPRPARIVDVQGGAADQRLAMTETSDDAFLEALQRSLEATYVAGDAAPETVVKVSFADPYRAWMGLDMTVTARLSYQGRPADGWRSRVGEGRADAAKAAMQADIADFIAALRTAMRANARATISSDTVVTASR
jgi:hypothetical protein